MEGKKLFQDSLAEELMERSGRKYRPSNGTEGDIFMSMWCGNCIAADEMGMCEIVDGTMGFDVDDPGYPKEWQYDVDGQPICAAFREKP
jgi:hypothetical protein